MKKELNELTEEQAKKVSSIVEKEFAYFKCEENGGKVSCDIFFKDKNFLRILSSGVIFFIDEKYKPLPAVSWSFIDVVDYLRSEGFSILNKFDKKVVINNDEDRTEFIKNYFKNISEEKLAEFTEIADKYSGIGPTVEEYLSQFQKNFLELIKSGKVEKTENMSFSREGFSGHKLIDDPNLNFNLIEVNTKVGHPLKKVEEGIRIYRILDGYGAFYIQENSIAQNEIYFEVKYDDVILIKAGDSYRYEKGLGNKLNLFEINIKYP